MLEIMAPVGTTRVCEPLSILLLIGGKRADGAPLAAVGDKYLLIAKGIQFKESIICVESVASDGTAQLIFVSEEGFTVPGTHVLRVEKSDDITLFAERTVTVEPALIAAEPAVPPEATKAPLEWTVPRPAATTGPVPDTKPDSTIVADTRTEQEVFARVPIPPVMGPVLVKKTHHPLALITAIFAVIALIYFLYRLTPQVPEKTHSVPATKQEAPTPASPSKPAQAPKSPADKMQPDASSATEPDASAQPEPNPYLRRAKRKR